MRRKIPSHEIKINLNLLCGLPASFPVPLMHQNYLRRKANGKQKEYEDKVKEKKKAEIEAKKEAIRQEDIAKGVFVPVAMLPTAEPKKGVASV